MGNIIHQKKGFSIIEILVAITIIAIAFSSLLGMAVMSLKISATLEQTDQANSLAQESMEAIRNFRDGTSWNENGLGTVLVGTDYHFVVSASSSWELVQGPETIGQFSRSIVFINVSRDSDDNIVQSGGTNDPNTKEAEVTVNWTGHQVVLDAYFTNWQ